MRKAAESITWLSNVWALRNLACGGQSRLWMWVVFQSAR